MVLKMGHSAQTRSVSGALARQQCLESPRKVETDKRVPNFLLVTGQELWAEHTHRLVEATLSEEVVTTLWFAHAIVGRLAAPFQPFIALSGRHRNYRCGGNGGTAPGPSLQVIMGDRILAATSVEAWPIARGRLL
jgi:hypothetical protein